MERCTYPGCNFQADYILSTTHTIPHHNMTRREVQKKHGKFLTGLMIPSATSKWINKESPTIASNAFDHFFSPSKG